MHSKRNAHDSQHLGTSWAVHTSRPENTYIRQHAMTLYRHAWQYRPLPVRGIAELNTTWLCRHDICRGLHPLLSISPQAPMEA